MVPVAGTTTSKKFEGMRSHSQTGWANYQPASTIHFTATCGYTASPTAQTPARPWRSTKKERLKSRTGRHKRGRLARNATDSTSPLVSRGSIGYEFLTRVH